MKIIATFKSGEAKDITEISGDVNIGGSKGEVSRKMDFEVIRPKVDSYLPSVDISLGSLISFYDEKDKEQFSGVVWFRDFDDNSISQKITCYDIALYTSKSNVKTEVFNKKSCSEIATSCLSELGLPIGELEPGEVLTFNGRNKNAYDIIMGAYKEASKKNKKQYQMVVIDGKVSVVEQGKMSPIKLEYKEQHLPGGILKISYSESIDNMVNAVKVIKDKEKDKKKDAAQNNEDAENFGLVQKIIKGEEADTKGILKSATSEIDVECFGDFSLKTGFSVYIESKKVKGKYYIISDSHDIKDNIHTCKLKLSSENTMGGGGNSNE